MMDTIPTLTRSHYGATVFHPSPKLHFPVVAVKCPRCDSSNTKFCYCNNYSSSQPRHYCKACKRYWTKGGTLRNVPIGGACRKNKRLKRLPATLAVAGGANPNNPPSIQPRIHVSSTSSNHINNPLLYGFPCFDSGVSGLKTVTDYDHHQPQMNTLGLGFSSGLSSIPLNPLLSSSSNILTASTPTIASLLASTLHQHNFNNLPPFGDLQITGTSENVSFQAQVDQIDLYDPIGSWHDQESIGSSLTSLI